jgi:hypothetical protein
MTEPLLLSRQRTALHDLYQAANLRARLEPQVEHDFQARQEAIEKEFQESCGKVIQRFESEKEGSQQEFEQTQKNAAQQFEAERTAQDTEWQDAQQRITAQSEADNEAAKREYQAARNTAATTLKADQAKADETLVELQERIAEGLCRSQTVEQEAKALLKLWRQERDYGELPEGGKPGRIYQEALRQFEEALTTSEEHLDKLRQLRLPGFFQGARPFVVFAILILVLAGGGAAMGGADSWPVGLAVGAGFGAVLSVVLGLWFYVSSRSQIRSIYQPLRQALGEADVACQKARKQARTAHEKRVAVAEKSHEKKQAAATEKYRKRQAEIQERRNAAWTAAETKYQTDIADSTQRRDTTLRLAHEKYQKLRTEIYARYETDSQQIHERHYKQKSESKQRHEQEWKSMADHWRQALAEWHRVVEAVNRESKTLFPVWEGPAWKQWVPPTNVPPAIRFGEYRVDLSQVPNAMPQDERLKPPEPTQLALPALLSFPERCSLLLKSGEEGRSQAVQTLQAVMLRDLTCLPPGKVRFTILDPVGLGENFGAFMHLADYDEHLVTSRVWTETGHIEQRLEDLTAHMENVLQKYLRNLYKTIEEYNAQAGEVAEPFRILVVANFPIGFSAEAARRLISIVSSGPRCGVYALISLDTSQEAPMGFNLAALEAHTVNLEWQGQRFLWKDEDFQPYPLRTDLLPGDEFCTRIMQVVGARAREANKVEVPFEFIAAAPQLWWTSDSRSGVEVPLGRAGATKRQPLKLGHGTSQHVVIAGKTGSGKSTLLHALITNLSLFYSPEEVELYLIDFKKGVEFKTYAAHELPHARVVAIESDREFGLSVLQRLDAELKQRGEQFREVGAQDLKSYREANGSKPLPRILLIVDEFQEFFTEDDKVSQDAAGLLDRLVRQGRAFGLHILLGSQTLGGAYTLARSTIDQMAVRIALQCSEADAHLILSDDNSAARLLSRPGEAIYNDANGLVEGNNPFQVVWLPEERRESYLEQIRELDRRRNPRLVRTQIVFEGNVLANIGKNVFLNQSLAGPTWPAAPVTVQAWLGEAIAIKDPTAAVFRRQSGSNLLLIGQQADAALGILTAALISLAAQQPPANDLRQGSGARFYVLDGTPAESPQAGTLAQVAGVLPHPVQVVGGRELPGLMAELAEEVERRQKATESEGPSVYLLIHGLQRFRDLRKPEDDFGYSSNDQPPTPAKQFASIMREGAGLGVHTLIWCDALNNVTRSLDRQALREFDMRVLFQMSANDSSTLIDSPVAGKLGAHRALFHSEEEGKLEKFRPYGLPPPDWLEQVQQQLRRKRVAKPIQVTSDK